MASRSSGAVSITRASGGHSAMISRGTSDPANRHTGQRATRFWPRTVIRSGAPGPAPMKWTVMTPSPPLINVLRQGDGSGGVAIGQNLTRDDEARIGARHGEGGGFADAADA